MRTFTPTEIDLCKKIAEKEGRSIGKGDWYLDINLILLSTSDAWVGQKLSPDLIPLWQEHDCLEWLRKKKWCIELSYICEPKLVISYVQPHEESQRLTLEGDTPLEALLKAVLATLKAKP